MSNNKIFPILSLNSGRQCNSIYPVGKSRCEWKRGLEPLKGSVKVVIEKIFFIGTVKVKKYSFLLSHTVSKKCQCISIYFFYN